jgi:hypothetical protein
MQMPGYKSQGWGTAHTCRIRRQNTLRDLLIVKFIMTILGSIPRKQLNQSYVPPI